MSNTDRRVETDIRTNIVTLRDGERTTVLPKAATAKDIETAIASFFPVVDQTA